jgi:hypothetical protein
MTDIADRWSPLGEHELRSPGAGDASPLEVVWDVAVEELDEQATPAELLNQDFARAILDIREQALDAQRVAFPA